MNYRLRALSTSLACLLTTPIVAEVACADQGSMLVRGRIINIQPANKSTGGMFPENAISISSKAAPEVDFSYFLTQNIAAELVVTYPQQHDVSVNGYGTVGSFKELPPTLTVQYHFSPTATVSPYLGAGINYTRISNVNFTQAGFTAATLSKNNIGLALQAGTDINITNEWLINFDIKKIQLRPDVKVNGNTVSTIKADPWIVGVGVGYRF